jgi:uncharacterized integral membrane protein
MNAYLLGALFFIAGMVVFILQNDAQVSIRFLDWQTSQISLAVVIIISACIGALITFLLDSFRAFKTGQKLRKLGKVNQKNEQELTVLRGKQAAYQDQAATSRATGEDLKPTERGE